MKIYIDEDGKIIDVRSTDRTDLTEIELDETAIDYPFSGWSDARICCYRVEVEDGQVIMFTPYVPTNIIPKIEDLEAKNAETRLLQEENDTELLYQVCLLQLGITEEDL